MTFFLLLLVAFIAGIRICIPIAKYISPPPASLLFILFTPWTILYFFAQNPTISTIREMYFSFLIGMCIYWTYFETIKKLKGR